MNASLLLPLVITFILFPLAGAAALRIPRKEPRNGAFLAVNAAGAFSLCALTAERGVHFHQAKSSRRSRCCFSGCTWCWCWPISRWCGSRCAAGSREHSRAGLCDRAAGAVKVRAAAVRSAQPATGALRQDRAGAAGGDLVHGVPAELAGGGGAQWRRWRRRHSPST
jgi:hypothetical protein